jgi:hypothetical protein
MEKVLSYNEFISEGAEVAPEIAIAMSIAATAQKLKALKTDMMEEPEKRVITQAKMEVELEKIDAFNAKKKLMTAQEFEEQRKEREKVKALRDKAAESRKKAKK